MSQQTRYLSLVVAAAIATTAACSGAQTGRAPESITPAAMQVPERAVPGAHAAATKPLRPPALRLGDAIRPISYAAHLTLDPRADSFQGTITIRIDIAKATDHMWLNARALTVEDASLVRNGSRLALATLRGGREFVGFAFPTEIQPGRATLTIRYRGKVSRTDEAGLFRQKRDGRWYLYSQFEAIDARRAFPCFDQPNFKVPWQLRLTIGRNLVAVSNTPVVSRRVDPKNGEKTVTFAQTRPIPSYLVALAVGPFDVIKGGKVGRNKVPFRLILPHGDAAAGAAAYAVKATPTFVKLLEDYFDLAYPYRKLDLIAVPHFFGAMENPGAITCAESILTRARSRVTDSFKRVYAHVVAHELAHQWFGDLVTLAWWNDTWLNESFADWLSLKLIYEHHPEWNGAVRATLAADRAKAADRLASAHEIREPIKSDDDIAHVFSSGIAYAKGRTVLNMFERWIGEKTFQRGVRAYIRAHAWKTAAAPDFLAALAAASRPEVAKALQTFIDQPGAPLISVKLACKAGKTPALSLSQQRYVPIGSTASPDETWSVPVCVAYPNGSAIAHKCRLLTTKTAVMRLTGARRCPRWVLANDHAAGYYRVAYRPAMLRALLRARRLSPAEELDIVSDMRALVGNGSMTESRALTTLPALIRRRNPYLTRAAAGLVAGIDIHLVPKTLRGDYARFVRRLFGRAAHRLGWRPRRHDSDAVRALRRAIVPLVAGPGRDAALAGRARALTWRWLKDRSGIAPDLVGRVLDTAARHGGVKLYSACYRAATVEKNPRYRRLLLGAMASFRDPALLKRNLHLFVSDRFDRHDASALLRVPYDWQAGRDLLWSFLTHHFEEVRERMPATIFGSRIIYTFAAGFCDARHRGEVAAFFKHRIAELRGSRRTLAKTLETMQLCASARRTQAQDVVAFLKRQ